MEKNSNVTLAASAVVAIEGSIKKWEGILNNTETDNRGINCPLCKEYGDASLSCIQCPVREFTKKSQCRGTPYSEWTDHHDSQHSMCKEKIIHCETCKELCKKEISFLKSLLTKREIQASDKVEVRDGSWSLALLDGEFSNTDDLTGKVYNVIATGLVLPESGSHKGEHGNNTIIQWENSNTSRYIFIRKEYLRLAQGAYNASKS